MRQELNKLQNQFNALKKRGLKLDLTRGKPSTEQVALANGLDGILHGNYLAEDGTDTRNYGGLRGLPEARKLGALLMDIPAENVICAGNSSLQLMYITVDTLMHVGLSSAPLRQVNSPTVLCPVPGYDRHFTLTDALGLKMKTVPMLESGPDMDIVESLVDADSNICAIWCVPKHSNPTGATYSDETVQRLAKLPTRRSQSTNPVFVLWDNAYAVHDFKGYTDLSSIFNYATESQTLHRIVLFASTSKITHAGAGIAFVGAAETNLQLLEQRMSAMTVGPDKVNQLRHAKFLRDAAGIRQHMEAHAGIVRPKFQVVADALNSHLGNSGLATWTQPSGGYFVSLDLQPGLAAKTVELAREAGLALTPAGATFPYGNDPTDSNLRLAPTFGQLRDLEPAVEILAVSCKLAAALQS